MLAGQVEVVTVAEGGESDYEEDEAFATAPAAEHVEQYHGRGYQPCNATQQEALTASSAISQPSCSEAAEQQQPVHQDIWAAQPSSSDIAASDLSGSTVKTPPTNDEHQDARCAASVAQASMCRAYKSCLCITCNAIHSCTLQLPSVLQLAASLSTTSASWPFDPPVAHFGVTFEPDTLMLPHEHCAPS